MPEICAAMGLTNLGQLDAVVIGNRKQYLAYRAELSQIDGLALLPYDERETGNFQYIVVELGQDYRVDRDELVRALHAENILARKYFWPGCHAMKPYTDLQPSSAPRLENTRRVAGRVIVLPTGPSLPDGAIETIGAVMRVLN